MSRPIAGKGGYLGVRSCPKNTNLVENVHILLPVKFISNFVQRLQRRI